MIFKLMKIAWHDATSWDEHYEIHSDKFKTSPVISVGFLISQNDKQIVIARDMVDSEEEGFIISGVECIPKPCDSIEEIGDFDIL